MAQDLADSYVCSGYTSCTPIVEYSHDSEGRRPDLCAVRFDVQFGHEILVDAVYTTALKGLLSVHHPVNAAARSPAKTASPSAGSIGTSGLACLTDGDKSSARSSITKVTDADYASCPLKRGLQADHGAPLCAKLRCCSSTPSQK